MSDEKLEQEGLPVVIEDDAPESAAILRFYDRLRRTVAGRASRKGAVGRGAAELFLLVPDVFFLIARMAIDRRVPNETRALLGGALAYFLLPIDLVPEAFLGLGGYLDDLVISSAVLQKVFDRDLEAIAEEHWNGSQRVREAIAKVVSSTDVVLSGRGLERVKRYLKDRDLETDPPTAPPTTP